MKKSKILNTSILSAIALGLTLSASAQTQGSAAPQTGASADPGPGLVGTNYAEVDLSYQRQQGAPEFTNDYQFVSNTAFFKSGTYGADANFTYDYLRGSSSGFTDHREDALFGLTGYTLLDWGKPFVTADAGMAWEHAGGVSRKGFAYDLTAGVEFQVLKDLELTPFIEYSAEPHLYNHELPEANMPDHLFDYGVKATYRFTKEWKASLSADLDEHSAKDWGLRAGVSYSF